MRIIRTVKQWLAEKKKQEYIALSKKQNSGIPKVNPLTGQINLKYVYTDISEDYFIGTYE
jgi:hypothetical protein